MESDAPLELVTCAIDDIFPATDYFLVNVLRYGKEIYSMPQEEIKRAAARDLMFLGREYLEASQAALEGGRHRLAIDGGYHAAELAAKGLILLQVDGDDNSRGCRKRDLAGQEAADPPGGADRGVTAKGVGWSIKAAVSF